MDKQILNKANELNSDIENIEKVLKDHYKHKWIRVISPNNQELHSSVTFQDELAEWLEAKKAEYQKALEEL